MEKCEEYVHCGVQLQINVREHHQNMFLSMAAILKSTQLNGFQNFHSLGLQSWLSSLEHLIFQRTQVQFQTSLVS